MFREPVSPKALEVSHTASSEHAWELRMEEFEDGRTIRRFECVECGAVRFE